MTQTTPTPSSVKLPVYRPDYTLGQFANTMTGEIVSSIEAVVLDYREDRVLWDTWSGRVQPPLCVNGSELGPCDTCSFAQWENGQPPACSEKLSLLLSENGMLSVLTARRSMLRPVEQWIGMMAASGTPLFAQSVRIGMRHAPPVPGTGDLFRLALVPADVLATGTQTEMRALRDKARSLFNLMNGR